MLDVHTLFATCLVVTSWSHSASSHGSGVSYVAKARGMLRSPKQFVVANWQRAVDEVKDRLVGVGALAIFTEYDADTGK